MLELLSYIFYEIYLTMSIYNTSCLFIILGQPLVNHIPNATNPYYIQVETNLESMQVSFAQQLILDIDNLYTYILKPIA